ncbi:FAD-dependent oxidoreductase [Streptomyces sp. NPDC057555]|uniref:FAD-dependent oxidoreductase n=1 Tax=Streptomyces sp. NPDC057555 TaxID=3346166 RepID=UPI0036810556
MSGNPLQVLVVGAGPTGLTVAHELLRRGVAVRLVDAAQGPAATSRALATHARTLEVYDQMGVLPALLPQGRAVRKFSIHQNGRRLAALHADYSRLPTRFPMTVMVDQALTEKTLREAVRRLGGRIEWGVRLESLDQDAEGVTVRLRTADGGDETVRVPWLVGCDGGHSTVRKLLELRLVGDSTETWLIADARLDAELDDRSLHWLRNRDGALMAVPFPEPGKWRLLDTVDAVYDGDPDAVADRFSRKLSEAVGHPVTVHRPSWVSVFTIQQRMITAMRKDRCLVAGDAAHVHSPASGQGMNTGIQDAYNLGWKLAAVARGEAPAALLDSYPAERLPVGAQLLASTNRATALIQLKSRLAALALPLMFGVVGTVRPLSRKISRKIMRAMSALDLSYHDSPLTTPAAPGQEAAAGPAPGRRAAELTAADADDPGCAALLAELRDPRCTLLVRASRDGEPHGTVRELADSATTWLSVRAIAATDTADRPAAGPVPLPDPDGTLSRRLGLTAPGAWLLVRPDGYVAARGPRMDGAALTAALTRARGGRLPAPVEPVPGRPPTPVAPGPDPQEHTP